MGSRVQSWRLSIRLKIILLIAGTLGLSLAAFVYLGATVIEEDKASYIYDFNSSALRGAAERIDRRFFDVHKFAQLLGRVLVIEKTPVPLLQFYDEWKTVLGIRSVVFLKGGSDGKFAVIRRFGKGTERSLSMLDELGWTPQSYDAQTEPYRLGDLAGDGAAPVGGKVLDADGGTLAYLALVQPDPKLLDSLPPDFDAYLTDARGRLLLARAAKADSVQVAELEKRLPRASGAAGVRPEEIGGQSYLVSYQRFGQDKLLLVSLVPRTVVQKAARTLVVESLRIGLGILLLACGLALFLAKGITARLRQIWHAARKIGEGDFTSRIASGAAGVGDEVSELATSFNLMSGRIEELIVETADKARMEKELETAQAFQSRYFPWSDFEAPSFRLAGKYLPASECAGDWWHYARLGDHLLIFVGDVTGHGVSAALVTAQVHGAVGQWLLTQEGIQDGQPPPLSELLAMLNAGLLRSVRNEVSMTFLAISIDLRKGLLTGINCSHPKPCLYRKNGSTIYETVMEIPSSPAAALGLEEQWEAQPFNLQLEPGDRLIFYTDGIIEMKDENFRRIKRRDFLGRLQNAIEAAEGGPRAACEGFFASMQGDLGRQNHLLTDDLTLVIGMVPEDCHWS